MPSLRGTSTGQGEGREGGAGALPHGGRGPSLLGEDGGREEAHGHAEDEEGPVLLVGGQGVVQAHGEGGERVAAQGRHAGGQRQAETRG